jgi:haloalkane dehalogenase
MAYVDEGPRDGAVVLMLHGEPTWGFLYRKMIPLFVRAGMRAIAPDLIGFGRSDKPTLPSAYSYSRHVAWVETLVRTLDLRQVVLVVQDWGSLIGLRLAAEHEGRFARIVVANGFLPTATRPVPAAFHVWRAFSRYSPIFPIARIVGSGCVTKLPPRVRMAYDAPFPSRAYQAGARIFPSLVPTRAEDPAVAGNRAAWDALGRWNKPFLTLFGKNDPIFGRLFLAREEQAAALHAIGERLGGGLERRRGGAERRRHGECHRAADPRGTDGEFRGRGARAGVAARTAVVDIELEVGASFRALRHSERASALAAGAGRVAHTGAVAGAARPWVRLKVDARVATLGSYARAAACAVDALGAFAADVAASTAVEEARLRIDTPAVARERACWTRSDHRRRRRCHSDTPKSLCTRRSARAPGSFLRGVTGGACHEQDDRERESKDAATGDCSARLSRLHRGHHGARPTSAA